MKWFVRCQGLHDACDHGFFFRLGIASVLELILSLQRVSPNTRCALPSREFSKQKNQRIALVFFRTFPGFGIRRNASEKNVVLS